MRWWAQHAKQAGAQLRYGSLYRKAKRQDKQVWIDDGGLQSRFLVGADGAKSRVAEDFNLGYFVSIMPEKWDGAVAQFPSAGLCDRWEQSASR